jgi:UDP-3-O-[3-hydroxymyristoyl] glucosamine N-acyltransferase
MNKLCFGLLLISFLTTLYILSCNYDNSKTKYKAPQRALQSKDSVVKSPNLLSSDNNGNLSLFDINSYLDNNDFSAKTLSLTNNNLSINSSGDITTNGKITSTGDVTTYGKFVSSGDISTNGKINSQGVITTSDKINSVGDISTNGKINSVGNISTNGNITSKSNIYANQVCIGNTCLTEADILLLQKLRTGASMKVRDHPLGWYEQSNKFGYISYGPGSSENGIAMFSFS